MQGRTLSRKDALAEYLVYRRRTYEHLHMFQILLDLKDKTYTPQNSFSKNFTDTVQHMVLGVFASLMDSHRQALNVFDVWVALYPSEKTRIEETWRRIKPHIKLIRDLRNKVCFHACKNLRDYIKALRTYEENTQVIGGAMAEFGKLAKDLIGKESESLPNLKEEAGPILRKAGVPEECLEKVVEYFL